MPQSPLKLFKLANPEPTYHPVLPSLSHRNHKKRLLGTFPPSLLVSLTLVLPYGALGGRPYLLLL